MDLWVTLSREGSGVLHYVHNSGGSVDVSVRVCEEHTSAAWLSVGTDALFWERQHSDGFLSPEVRFHPLNGQKST